MPLSTDLFDYPLPPELIAQVPAVRRDHSKLLVVDRAAHRIAHTRFGAIGEWLRPGDRLFRNNAAVIPARLSAVRPTGGQVECFLLAPADKPQVWRCLLRPARKLEVGAKFHEPSDLFSGEVIAREEAGAALVRFTTPRFPSILEAAQACGEVPLPPYIARADASRREEDRRRYQTVYALPSRPVAAAAPTAGLHFTPELVESLAKSGVTHHDLTLHVGLGTFRPVSTPTIEEHAIHREIYEIPAGTQAALFPPLPGRRVAVGTTAVRSIEDFLGKTPAPLSGDYVGDSALFVYPPRAFRGIDALITNFHLPRSTLLCLVAAFLAPGSTDGIGWLREIYAEAIAERYRFLSYGDAMLII
jgi:S-adenosylmethionine:tRNA ribosyltransferase-isomerase